MRHSDVAPKIIPITNGLKLLLHRKGYEKNKGSIIHILHPDRTGTSTNAMIENISRGFTYFYKQLNTGRDLYQ